MIQLDFFQEFTEIEVLQNQIRDMQKSHDKLRKALFARHGELSKKYIELNERMEVLEKNICKGFFK